jgi:hypothetical protein
MACMNKELPGCEKNSSTTYRGWSHQTDPQQVGGGSQSQERVKENFRELSDMCIALQGWKINAALCAKRWTWSIQVDNRVMAERAPAPRPRPRTASAAAVSATERVAKSRTPPPRSRSRSYQTPLRGNTSSSSSDDDDADARSWKSNGSRWGSDGSGVAGPSSKPWRETAALAKRDNIDVKKRVIRDPHRRRDTVYSTDEEVDEYGFRNEDFVKATLYRPPMTLAEENRILKEELEIVKQVNHFVYMIVAMR